MSNPQIDPNRQYVIGTAGHIDHGKTALVKALTGVDTDNLPEEKLRGITIDLGFAHFSKNITIIDVPGHERLIKNMVAGVSAIDLVVFVIAADDGVMPQSREHLDIINLLQIQHGVFVITKTDLADQDWLNLVEEDIGALLQESAFKDSRIIRTSTATGEGIEELRDIMMQTLAKVSARPDREIFRQPVDRAFSAKGFGTVITGTVLSGNLKTGDEVEIQPTGLLTRVRGLQSHDQDVTEVNAGYRAAVNLAGTNLEDIDRGMVLVKPGLYDPVEVFNARLKILKSSPIPLKNNQRIRLHVHTAETFARVIIPHAQKLSQGETAFVQFKLEQPLHAAFQDRFIIRQYSPQRTLGGGVILQCNPFRFRKKYADLFLATSEKLNSDDEKERIPAVFNRLKIRPLKLWQLKTATNLPLRTLQNLVKELQSQGVLISESIGGKTYYFSEAQLNDTYKRLERILGNYHQTFPGRSGMSEAEIISKLEKFFTAETVRKSLDYSVKNRKLARDSQKFRLVSFTPQLSVKDSGKYRELETCYQESQFGPPTVKEVMEKVQLSQKEFKELTKILRDERKLVYVDETLFFHSSVFPVVEDRLRKFFSKKGEITVGEFKDLTNTTRKYAIPLLVYLDSCDITERDGNVRKAGYKIR